MHKTSYYFWDVLQEALNSIMKYIYITNHILKLDVPM